MKNRINQGRKVKILLGITKSNWGGAQRYVFDIATNLSIDQFNVVVAAGGNGRLYDKLRSHKIDTVSVPKLDRDIRIFHDLKVFRLLFRLFKDEKPDIVHLNSSKAGFLGCLAARILGIPRIIFTAHGWPFTENIPPHTQFLYFLLSWLTALFAHKVIVVSKRDAIVASKFLFLQKQNIHLIHNGVKIISILSRHEAQATLQKYCKAELSKEKIWIGTVGELHKNKCHELLISAIKDLPLSDLEVLIIGDGEERNSLKADIQQADLTNTIHLLGHVDHVARLLPAFDIIVLPSAKEGFPYVLLEAGLNSVAVAASRVGGVPDIITHNKNGLLFQNLSSTQLCKNLLLLIQDQGLRQRLGQSLNATVTTNFTLTRLISETVEAYQLD